MTISISNHNLRRESKLAHSFKVGKVFDPQLKWLLRFDKRKPWLNSGWYFVAKRLLDISLVLLISPIIFPIILMTALLIKVESPDGPVFFMQKRTGKGGRRFQMFKFRTMVANAEEMKKELAHLNELQWPDFKITNDPRITRIGKILRKTSIDELPQLINVLKGDMSLVGPRPTSFAPETYELWHTERLDVVPGITGLWQVVGRGETEFNDRVILDVAYILRRCFLLDLLILIQTVLAIVQQRGRH